MTTIKGTTLVNLCPHDVTFSGVIDGRPQMTTIPTSGSVCRVATESHQSATIGGFIPTQKQTFGDVYGLPDPALNTIYIVSGIVIQALKLQGCKRSDVIAPATGPRDNALRDAQGQILAVSCFNSL